LRPKGAINNYARTAGENWDCQARVSQGLEARMDECRKKDLSLLI
jgi:hypothetical protein